MRRRILYHKTVSPERSITNYLLVIDNFSYASVAHDATEIYPVIQYHYTPVYDDGTYGDVVYNTDSENEATVEFTIATDYPSTVSVDADGVIHCDAWEDYLENIGEYRLVGTVTMTVKIKQPNTTNQYISETKDATAYQASVDIDWDTPVVNLTYDPNPAPAQPDVDGGTIVLTPTVKWTQTGKYSDGTDAPEHNEKTDSSAVYTFSSTDGNLKPDTKDGTLVVDSSTIESEHDLGTIQVQVDVQGETGYGTCLIKQQEYYPPVTVQNLMDVVFYNKNNGKLCIMNRFMEDYSDYPKATYTPIGIVIAECVNSIETYGQNGYNAGKVDGFSPQTIGIMALNNAVKDTVMWGGVDAQYWLIPSSTGNVVDRIYTIPLIGKASDSEYNGDWASDSLERGNPAIIGMPSDLFSDIKSADESAYYKDGYDMYTLSPYTSGLFHYNTKYWEECSEKTNDGASYYNCFSDFSGEEKSQVYLHRMTDEGLDRKWMDSDEINTNKYMLPAMETCYKYSTNGTGQGTWYLPAAGELGHITARASAIDETLSELASTYGVSVTKLSSASNIPYLASTIGFFTDLNGHVVAYPDNGGVSLQWNEGDEVGVGYIRPFKRMDVYYREKDIELNGITYPGGYFHDGDRTEKEWYDQIPTAYKDEYAQHIGIYRTTGTSGSSNYPTGAVSGIVYGILVNSESDLTVVRTDVPLFTIESLGTGNNTVVTFDQNPQCGWYIPQYVAVDSISGVIFINSSIISVGDVVPKTAWQGNISIINRYSESIDGIGTSNGDSGYYADEIPVLKAGDWNFNIGIFMHSKIN